ncbi:HNH endonuclease [Candidatus Dependentiae bacterium]|nr:HNH endonuclease [Candidatus Dependentiae bacterium]
MLQKTKLCECGCGQEVTKPGNRFIHGHTWKTKTRSEETKKSNPLSEEAKKKMSKAKKGEKHPNWRGGVSFEPYCRKFTNEIKEQVRDEFGRMCFLCEKTEKENVVKLSIHHIDYNKSQGCDDHEWKLVPLCRSCHTKTNFNRDYWIKLILDKLENIKLNDGF